MELNPYRELANAIVVQAAKDYKKAVKRRRKYPKDEDAQREIRDLRRFFHSGWYSMLTEVDGDRLIKDLERSVDA